MGKIARSLAAATAMVLMTSGANASVFGILDGQSFDIRSSTHFNGVVVAEGGAGSFTVNFFTDADPTFGEADLTINAGNFAGFEELSVSWESEDNLTTLATAPVMVGANVLGTEFTVPYLSQDLVFEWTDSSAGAGFDFTVVALPLPTGALLLGTALVGLGAARRRAAR